MSYWTPVDPEIMKDHKFNKCPCGAFPILKKAFNTVQQKDSFNWHCEKCKQGLGQYASIEKAVSRWNEITRK